MKKHFPLIVFLLSFSFFLISFPMVKAQELIYIKSDGSVEGTDKIQRNGDVYTLIGNIEGNLTIERSNVVLFGDWYSIQDFSERGFNVLTIKNVNNVTVKNLIITGNRDGLRLLSVTNSQIIDNVISRNRFLNDANSGISGFQDCQDNVISGNFVANFSKGIYFRSDSTYSHTIIGNTVKSNHIGINIMMGHEGEEKGNIISENQIIDNSYGIITQWFGEYYLWKPDPFEMNNKIYKNNFINNTQSFLSGHLMYDPDTSNIWDNGINGNYWSDYNGTETNNDGIGDTPHVLDVNNKDNFPLIAPVEVDVIPEFPSFVACFVVFTSLILGLIFNRKLCNRGVSPS